ncbi:MAG: SCO family protein [Desulfuromonadales bacterium]|nr:SCO family protein [Desulfuromonadales bacterium]
MLILLLMLCVSPAAAHVEEEHHFSPEAAQQPVSASLGVDEHIGSKLPLDLVFRDETGKAVRLGDLVSGPTIILPVYYGCTNVCYNLQWGLARVLPQLKSRPVSEYRVISVSFDEQETPAQAARFKKIYLAATQAPFPEDGWRFLTGEKTAIRQLTDAAGFHFQRKGQDFIHPVVSLVVSADGSIIRYLYGTTFLAKDLSLALLEAREGKTGATVRKVMEYCFTFDPSQKTYVFNLLRVSATVVIVCVAGFLVFLLLTGKKRRSSKTEDS